MLHVIQQAYAIEAHRIEVSASMGVSVYPYDCKSAHQLIRNADQSMYKAKRLGKNRCVIFDASLAEHEQTSSLVREQIRCALRKKKSWRICNLKSTYKADKLTVLKCCVAGKKSATKYYRPHHSYHIFRTARS
ncbi:hypothetical protein CWE07_10900 [Aliidiomarina maris]|uniref:GGDEF domain-containing protein n=1 Tax=Aliidiomarina maris TaxID=531312 RepID=A0ABY0BQ11_9GAMM|nr:hypothetical protein CWE07_10900 [Aliidiomarina maris]